MGRRNTSVLRTVRLPQELNAAIQVAAREKGVSVNALISSALKRYVRWDIVGDKLGFVPVERSTLRYVIEGLRPEKREEVAGRIARNVLKPAILFLHQDVNLSTFLSFLSLSSEYGHYLANEIKSSRNAYLITLRHDQGELYSTFLADVMRFLVCDSLGVDCVTQVLGNYVIVNFNLERKRADDER